MDIPADLTPASDAVASALTRVESVFARALETDHRPVAELCTHVERYRGKMLRPGPGDRLGHRDAPRRPRSVRRRGPRSPRLRRTRHGRRGRRDGPHGDARPRRCAGRSRRSPTRPTVNNLHGNEPAVILGDYLIATAYSPLLRVRYISRIARSRSRSAKQARSSALASSCNCTTREDWSLTEDEYFEIIQGKTGALTAVACELGRPRRRRDRHAAGITRDIRPPAR